MKIADLIYRLSEALRAYPGSSCHIRVSKEGKLSVRTSSGSRRLDVRDIMAVEEKEPPR